MPINMVDVDLVNSAFSRSILDLRVLQEVLVNVTEIQDLGIVQCFKCQVYGHTSITCTAKPRCVRCGGGHYSRLCTVPESSNMSHLTCVNCGGNHPASYRGCSSYKLLAEQLNLARPRRGLLTPGLPAGNSPPRADTLPKVTSPSSLLPTPVVCPPCSAQRHPHRCW